MSFFSSKLTVRCALGLVLTSLVSSLVCIAKPALAGWCNYSGCSIGYSSHINIVNNWWGVNGSGTSGSESIWTSGSSWGSVFNWTPGYSQYQVKTYPEAADGWAWGGFNGSPFPYLVGGNGSAWTGVSNAHVWGGSYDMIWDSFFNYSNNPGYSNPQAELEVWVSASFGNFGYAYQTYVDGIKYDVNINRSGNWPIVTYVPANGYNTGYNINILDVSRDAAYHGFLSYSMWLLDIDFGAEIYYGNSSCNVGSYYAP